MTVIPTFHCPARRCAEAIALYQLVFTMQIDWQGIDKETGLIYHTEVRIGDQRFRISDCGYDRETANADSLPLAVVYDSIEEVERAYGILKEEALYTEAPHNPGFATCFCEVKDKFGFRWFLMVD
jgi:PhnB protein